MSKRIKSFLITAASIFGTAFATIIFTPQWGDFTAWLGTAGGNIGAKLHLPAAVILLIGVLVAEVWKLILNQYILHQNRFDMPSISNGPELY